MKQILSLLAIGIIGVWTASAQTGASEQAGASAETRSAGQTNNSGAQVSGGGSAAAGSTLAASGKAADNSITLPAGTQISASLATSLDAKRSKAGDDVEVRTEEDIKQDGKIVLKKGTHLVGHVALAQARANGQTQSQLGIVFDYATLKDGRKIPFNASIRALASPAQSAMANSVAADDRMAAAGGMGAERSATRGGLVGGVASTANATTGAASGAVLNTASSTAVNTGSSLDGVTRSTGAVGGVTSAGRLAANSSGVFGLEGVSIDAGASTATQGSMIVSGTKNVHLDSGTQLLLRTGASVR